MAWLAEFAEGLQPTRDRWYVIPQVTGWERIASECSCRVVSSLCGTPARRIHLVDSKPVLVLKEPETHLHTQAARSPWKHVHQLPSQEVVTTHSPYFVQHLPFRDLQMVRLTSEGTEIRWLPAAFPAMGIPSAEGVEQIVNRSRGLLEYSSGADVLTAKGQIDGSTFSKLQNCFSDHDRSIEISDALEELRDESALCSTDGEL